MSNVKKTFVELLAFLESNQEELVSELMPKILELVSSKTNQVTSYKVDDEVVAIYCYYHKVWEVVSECEYGKKASSSTGLNTMCKDGVSSWSKQQRLAKVAKEKLLLEVASGEVEASLLTDELAAIEVDRKAINPGSYEGYENLNALINYWEA